MEWEKVKDLFHEALRDRRVLDDVDANLRREVESLLDAHEKAPAESVPEGPGSQIGPYKLLQKIGEGGFGVVYMAQQTEPVRRKVALKIIKLGMDTKQVVARFEVERQALAMMDHPNIAKVFDGGATDTGRPYFVMELVKGVPITEYCDQAQLDTSERLDLFAKVCHSVQHAHQKGIIHRDLKPSNVLVTLHDGTPVPKVIDFGIAKATDRELTTKTLFTEFRQWVGTPDYMAPEQAELSGLDIDTRADVYSLGVLLYELLTGTKPFDMKTLLEQGYEEIRRTIREVDPPKPSTRLSTMGEQLAVVAKKRHTAPALLGRALRGDLDWIVMKALEKDRSRRYETAAGFALDVQHYLRDEPVSATPPTAAYRARKYLTRHRVGATAAGFVLVALLVGGGLAFAGMRAAQDEEQAARTARARSIEEHDAAIAARALEAEQRARSERGAADAISEKARADTVIDFVNEMLSGANPDDARSRDTTVREMLEEFDRDLGDRLKEQPDVEATLRATMGTSFLGLGMFERAEPHLKAALDLRRREHGEDSVEYAGSLADWATLLSARGRYRDAMEHEERALAIFRRRLEASNPTLIASLMRLAGHLQEVARYDDATRMLDEAERVGGDRTELLGRRAYLAMELGDLMGAERAAREALRRRESELGPDHPSTCEARRLLGQALCLLARYEESERVTRSAIDQARRIFGDRHPRISDLLNDLANVLDERGAYDDAEATVREALAMRSELLGDEHPATAESHGLLAIILWHRGKPTDAEESHRTAMEMRRRTLGPHHPSTAASMNNLAMLLKDAGRYEEAEKLLVDAMAIQEEAFGGPNPNTAVYAFNIAMIRLDCGDVVGGERLLLEAIEMLRGCFGTEHPAFAQVSEGLAAFRRSQGDFAGAEKIFLRVLETKRRTLGDHHPSTIATSISVGAARALAGNVESAMPLLLDGLADFRQALGDRHPRVAGALMSLAEASRVAGDYDASEGYARAALDRCGDGRPRDRARAWQQLGWTLQAKDDVEAAVSCHETAIKLLTRIFGPYHPETAASLGAIAGLRAGEGQLDDAIRYHQQALEMKRRFFKGDNARVATSLNNLGWTYLLKGDLDLAEEALEKSLEMRRRLGGKNEGSLSSLYANLAAISERRGDANRAEERYRQALALAIRAHAAGHPQIAGKQHLLGRFLSRRGQLDEAESLLRAAMKINDEQLPEAHFQRLDGRLDLAVVLRRKGALDEAELLAQEAERHLTEDSVLRAKMLAIMGSISVGTGRPDEAERDLRESLAIERKLNDDDHPNVTRALRDLGWFFEQVKRFDEAEHCLLEAYAIDRRCRRDQAAAAAVDALCRVLHAKGDLDAINSFCREVLASYGDADKSAAPIRALVNLSAVLGLLTKDDPEAEIPIYRRLLELQRKQVGDDHVATQTTRSALASALYRAGRIDEAEEMMRPLLDVPQFRVAALGLIGGILLDRGEWNAAEPLLQECLKRREIELPNHWLRFNAMSMLGESLAKQGQYAKAEPLLIEGYEKMEPPAKFADRRPQALERIIELYEAWNKPDEAAAWRAKR